MRCSRRREAVPPRAPATPSPKEKVMKGKTWEDGQRRVGRTAPEPAPAPRRRPRGPSRRRHQNRRRRRQRPALGKYEKCSR